MIQLHFFEGSIHTFSLGIYRIFSAFWVSSIFPKIAESQTGWGWRPTPAQAGPPELGAHDHAQPSFEDVQGQRLSHLSGQPVHSTKTFPDVQRKPPPGFALCLLPLAIFLPPSIEDVTVCSESSRWKIIYGFCSWVPLEGAAQDSHWQNLWFT